MRSEYPGPPRPPGAIPVERVRGERPDEPAWRGDALGGSRHSRLAEHLLEPLEDFDEDRAAAICAEVCRRALADLAPALILLPAAERRRAQALGAYGLMLFDFAGQPGLEGDRLAQINRWQFSLEEALDGSPPGQPVFVLMGAEHRRRPWPLEALDRLAELATRQAAAPSALQGQRARDLAAALSHALVGRPEPKAEALAAALLHLRPLLDEATAGEDGAAELDEIRGLLEKARLEGAGLPRGHRRAACFLRLAAGRLLGNLQREEAGRRTTLGLGARLALLLRARIAPGS